MVRASPLLGRHSRVMAAAWRWARGLLSPSCHWCLSFVFARKLSRCCFCLRSTLSWAEAEKVYEHLPFCVPGHGRMYLALAICFWKCSLSTPSCSQQNPKMKSHLSLSRSHPVLSKHSKPDCKWLMISLGYHSVRIMAQHLTDLICFIHLVAEALYYYITDHISQSLACLLHTHNDWKPKKCGF